MFLQGSPSCFFFSILWLDCMPHDSVDVFSPHACSVLPLGDWTPLKHAHSQVWIACPVRLAGDSSMVLILYTFHFNIVDVLIPIEIWCDCFLIYVYEMCYFTHCSLFVSFVSLVSWIMLLKNSLVYRIDYCWLAKTRTLSLHQLMISILWN